MNFLDVICLKRYLIIFLILFLGLPTLSGQEIEVAPLEESVIIEPGSEGSRIFGDLYIEYQLGKEGKVMTCYLYLSTQLAGLKTLLATAPVYKFDLVLGLGKSKGSLYMDLLPGNQLSTLNGDFTYTTGSAGDSLTFKGVIVGWNSKIGNIE